jgi:hypothetical protein
LIIPIKKSLISVSVSLSLSYFSRSLKIEPEPKMAVELWETLKEAIAVYTGLSPATFFTVLALFLAVYYVISGLFGSSDQYQRPQGSPGGVAASAASGAGRGGY